MEDRKLQLEENKYVLAQVNSWIASADSKIGVVVGLLSAVLAVVTFVAEKIFSKCVVPTSARPGFLQLFQCLTFISIVLYAAALITFVLTVIPRLTGSYAVTQYSIFYDNIRRFNNAAAYFQVAQDATTEDLNEEIVKEIYYNSAICSRKMRWLRVGMIFSMLCFITTMIAIGFYTLYIFGL